MRQYTLWEHTSCVRKQIHTEASATQRLREMRNSPFITGKDRLHIYQCPLCHWWHVGHRKKGNNE